MELDLNRLFKVLVIGGAIIGCSDETTVNDGGADPVLDGNVADTSVADTSVADTSVADTNVADTNVAGDGGNTLCFCPADCCESGEPKEGIECCWSTSC